MQKKTTYLQLQPEDRITIASVRQQGIGVRAIARTLKRAPSTIARKLARNTSGSQDYCPHHAQLRSAACRGHACGTGKLHVQSVLGRGEEHARLEMAAAPNISYPQAGLSSSTRVPGVARNHL